MPYDSTLLPVTVAPGGWSKSDAYGFLYHINEGCNDPDTSDYVYTLVHGDEIEVGFADSDAYVISVIRIAPRAYAKWIGTNSAQLSIELIVDGESQGAQIVDIGDEDTWGLIQDAWYSPGWTKEEIDSATTVVRFKPVFDDPESPGEIRIAAADLQILRNDWLPGLRMPALTTDTPYVIEDPVPVISGQVGPCCPDDIDCSAHGYRILTLGNADSVVCEREWSGSHTSGDPVPPASDLGEWECVDLDDVAMGHEVFDSRTKTLVRVEGGWQNTWESKYTATERIWPLATIFGGGSCWWATYFAMGFRVYYQVRAWYAAVWTGHALYPETGWQKLCRLPQDNTGPWIDGFSIDTIFVHRAFPWMQATWQIIDASLPDGHPDKVFFQGPPQTFTLYPEIPLDMRASAAPWIPELPGRQPEDPEADPIPIPVVQYRGSAMVPWRAGLGAPSREEFESLDTPALRCLTTPLKDMLGGWPKPWGEGAEIEPLHHFHTETGVEVLGVSTRTRQCLTMPTPGWSVSMKWGTDCQTDFTFLPENGLCLGVSSWPSFWATSPPWCAETHCNNTCEWSANYNGGYPLPGGGNYLDASYISLRMDPRLLEGQTGPWGDLPCDEKHWTFAMKFRTIKGIEHLGYEDHGYVSCNGVWDLDWDHIVGYDNYEAIKNGEVILEIPIAVIVCDAVGNKYPEEKCWGTLGFPFYHEHVGTMTLAPIGVADVGLAPRSCPTGDQCPDEPWSETN